MKLAHKNKFLHTVGRNGLVGYTWSWAPIEHGTGDGPLEPSVPRTVIGEGDGALSVPLPTLRSRGRPATADAVR